MLPAPDRTNLRERTREDVYELIRSSAASTRAELIGRTGLPTTTVSHAIDRLLADGRIMRTEAQQKGPGSGSGRPGALYKAVATGRMTGAIDFGHGHILAAIANDIGDIVDEAEIRLDVDLDAVQAMDAATEQLKALQSRLRVAELAAVVAGIPGPVDRDSGLVCSPTILSGWVGLEPARELRRRLHAPVHIGNDATLGAYGERVRGAGRAHRDFLYVKASHGVGAGLVLDGNPYVGATGLAGEIGHTPLSGRSELCRCGRRGCLEAVVSVQAVTEQILHTHPGMTLGDVLSSGMEDPVTGTILEEAGRTLGRVLADLCNLFNPSAIIVGGELGASGPSLLRGIHASIARHAQPATAAALVVLPAELGVRAELVGAVQLTSQFVPR
jgi:predicted NBD/HSP70 family sugar kinase